MSRKNIYLTFINSKLKGNDVQFPTDLKPKNRVEEYLYGISQCLLGNSYTLPLGLKPKTREELFLKWLYDSCDNIGLDSSSEKKLALIDEVIVRVQPFLKVDKLKEYYIFKQKESLFNTIVTNDSVTIRKKRSIEGN